MAKDTAKKKDADAEEEKDEKEEKGGKKGKKDKKDDKPEGEEAKEGEGEGGEGEGGEAAPKKSKKKLIIFGVLGLVILAGAGAGAYFVFFNKPAEEDKAASKAVASAVYYTLPEFLVNLNSGTKQTSFLKATIVLELESSLDIHPLEGNLPKLMDAFNTYLRELRSSDLAGSAGIQRLREELLLRGNKAMAPIKINDVLFKEIIVQ